MPASDILAPAMITRQKAGPIDKTVLLFSGGLDSLIYDRLLAPDVLLYIPSNTRYSAAEHACIERLGACGYIDATHLVKLPGVLDLRQYERDDQIVPNRNAHLILLASNYGDDIQLASVYGDRSADKDEVFFQLMHRLLNHMWGAQHWTDARLFSVGAKFKRYTKTALVRKFLEDSPHKEQAIDALLVSYSCYRGEMQHCGICKPCFRKRVALVNAGISVPDFYWAEDFWKTEWFLKLWPVIRNLQYRGLEDAETLSALKGLHVSIPL